MGVDTNLYIRADIQYDDVLDVLKRNHSYVKFESTNMPGYSNIQVDNRRIFTSAESRTPLGPAKWLSLRSNPEGIAILREIADVFGGFLCEEDSVGTFKEIDGKLSQENALPYFIRDAIISGVEPHDFDGLKAHIEAWTAGPHNIIGLEPRK